jgi:hypothetical protein
MILKGDMVMTESIAFKKYKKAAHRREIRNGIFWMAFAIAMFIVCMPE